MSIYPYTNYRQRITKTEASSLHSFNQIWKFNGIPSINKSILFVFIYLIFGLISFEL